MNDKRILITGASGGIGQAIVQELTEAQLVLQYRSLGKKHAFSHLSNVQHLQFDLTKVEELARLLDELHDIDIFIHCVSAPISMKDLERKDWTDFQTHLNVQLKSFFLIFRRVVQGMRQKLLGKDHPDRQPRSGGQTDGQDG